MQAARNFANKLWNAARFVQMNLPEDFQPGLPTEDQLDMSDKWVLSELAKMAADATANLDKYELGLAAREGARTLFGKCTATGTSKFAKTAPERRRRPGRRHRPQGAGVCAGAAH